MKSKPLFILFLILTACSKEMITLPTATEETPAPEETPLPVPINETPDPEEPASATLWHVEREPLKTESDPIPYLFKNNGKLLAVIDSKLGPGFYEGGKAGMPLVDSSLRIHAVPDCFSDCTSDFLIVPTLTTLAISQGNIFGIV